MSNSKTTITKKELTTDIVKQYLSMDKSNNLLWIKDTPKAKKGSIAGTVREKDGYHSIVLLGVNYSGKQLKHFYQTGSWTTFFRKKEQVAITIKEKGKAKIVKAKVKVKSENIKTKKSIAQQISELPKSDKISPKFYDDNAFWNNDEK